MRRSPVLSESLLSPEEVQQQSYLLRYSRACAAARLSPDSFNALVVKTETGDPVEVADIHRVVTRFIDYCWSNDYYCGILAPFGHGKTTTLIGRVLWEIGHDTNIRIKVICATDDIAIPRVASIRRYLESDPVYRDVFPHVKPGNLAEWNKHRLYVDRRSKAVDPTLEAKGLFETGTGGRGDLLVFDDVIDYNNTIKNQALIPTAFDAINSVWLKRKESWTRVLSIGTAWHSADAYHQLRKVKDRWRWLICGISDDFSCIEAVIE